MNLNRAMFADNGGCGFVLKPSVFKDPEFDPAEPSTMKSKKVLHLKVVSGQRFKSKKCDPFVKVEVFGVKADCDQDKETRPVKNNGFDPVWNESLKFHINCPELAFVKFTVLDHDALSMNDVIGQFTVKFQSIKQGWSLARIKTRKANENHFSRVGLSSRRVIGMDF